MQRGLDPELAQQVARQLMASDALGAHTRDELGISKAVSARPVQAAWASAAAFTVGAGLPLLSAWLAPAQTLVLIVGATSLLFLALLGGAGGPHGRCAHCARHRAGDVLGRAGNGDHGGRRQIVRRGCLTG